MSPSSFFEQMDKSNNIHFDSCLNYLLLKGNKSQRLFITGEIDYARNNWRISTAMFTHFNDEKGFDYFLFDKGYASCFLADHFIKSGNLKGIKLYLDPYDRDFNLALMDYYKSCPKDKKFSIIGIAEDYNTENVIMALQIILENHKVPNENIEYEYNLILHWSGFSNSKTKIAIEKIRNNSLDDCGHFQHQWSLGSDSVDFKLILESYYAGLRYKKMDWDGTKTLDLLNERELNMSLFLNNLINRNPHSNFFYRATLSHIPLHKTSKWAQFSNWNSSASRMIMFGNKDLQVNSALIYTEGAEFVFEDYKKIRQFCRKEKSGFKGKGILFESIEHEGVLHNCLNGLVDVFIINKL